MEVEFIYEKTNQPMAQRLKQNFNEVQAILDAVGQKVDKVEGKGLSANDYTDEDKAKLAGIQAGAEANVQADWNQNDPSADDYVRNRTHWEDNGEVHKLDTKFLDLDSAPTVGSGNPVMSGGVKAAIADFITRSVNDLTNYYLKSEIYTKAEVENLIGAIQSFHDEIYPDLESVTHPANNILYLIGPTGTGSDKYEEYVYDSTKTNPWVKIGDTSIDLTGYVTTEALNTALASYVTSTALATALAAKQDTLVSGTNIKTINNQSILGEGNITIESGSPSVQSDWEETDTTDPAYIKNKPSIPAAQIQSDWNQADNTALDFIKNKPSIPSVSGFEESSNKVTSLSSSSTNTQYPSAKAAYDEIHPATGSSQPSGGMLPNIFYRLGTLSGNTTFTLATPVDSNIVNHYFWSFETGSTVPTITWPASITSWIGGSAPIINANTHYEISVLDGIGAYMEA